LNKLKGICSPAVLELLKYLRCLFLIRLGENENVESQDKAHIRNQLLALGEAGLRSTLKTLQLNLEVSDLNNTISNELKKDIGVDDELIQSLKSKLTELFASNEIGEQDQDTLYKNTEEQMCFADV
jgi:hypothetical protein